jgi:branched-chain amino acid transport system substrate-binding protein
VFEANGGQVIHKLWTPINVLDFAAYVSQIQSEADVVFSSYAGAPAVRFLKQYEESGLKQKIPLLATGMQVDESKLRAGGDEATGTVNALYWSPTVDNRASKDFVAVFTAKYGKTPSVYHMSMYSGAHWICEALKAVENKGNDPELLQAAIRSASKTIEDPRGPMTLDDHQNPIQNIYIFRVEKRDGKLENRVIHTYPNVSQFWTYSAAEFLKAPPYSRDYPPLKAPQ